MENPFQVKDVAKMTGIHSELVREYSRSLEINGYQIARTPQGMRKYTKNDIKLLKEISEVKIKTSADIDEIAAYIIQRNKAMKTTNPPKKLDQSFNEQNQKFDEFIKRIHTLTEQNETVMKMNQELIAHHQEQEEKIEELMYDLERRGNRRDEQLMSVIRQLQETKRQTAKSKRLFARIATLFTTKIGD